MNNATDIGMASAFGLRPIVLRQEGVIVEPKGELFLL